MLALCRRTALLGVVLALSVMALSPSRGLAQSLFGSSATYQLQFAPISIATGDFNNDSSLDFAVVGTLSGISDLQVFLGKGDGTFQPGSTYAVGSQLGGYYDATGVVAGDFNNDGILDLAVTVPNQASVALLLGNGDGTFQAPLYHAAGYSPEPLVAGDFNGDGNLDLAVGETKFSSGSPQGGVMILLGNGFGSFQDGNEYAAGNVVYSLTEGDLSSSGHLALITGNFMSRTASVLLGNGDGTFQPAVNYASGVNAPISVALGDFNGDGNLDLTVGGSRGSISVLLGNGDGTFGPAKLYNAGQNPNPVAVADFNVDGKLDIVTGNQPSVNGGISMLLGNGDGTFYKPIFNSSAYGPSCLATGDFNNDGLPDVLGCTGGVSVFVNTGPYPTATLSASTINFGQVKVGTTSPSQRVTLTNTGNSALQISSVVLGGTNAGDFIESTTCGSQLGFGASCTVRVSFRPLSRGTRTATVTITDNNPGTPQQTISLTGYGLPH
jgi:hypothetical protein